MDKRRTEWLSNLLPHREASHAGMRVDTRGVITPSPCTVLTTGIQCFLGPVGDAELVVWQWRLSNAPAHSMVPCQPAAPVLSGLTVGGS